MDDLAGMFIVAIAVVGIIAIIFILGMGIGQNAVLKPFNTCLEHKVDIVQCAEINGLIYKKE